LLHPKKVGTILSNSKSDEEKQTNEIKIAAPMLDSIDIKDKNITADALLTQREFARYLVETRKAHYFFTVKGNQKTLLDDIAYYFADNLNCNATFETLDYGHGRIEIRKIWVTSELNDYLDFPHIGQVFAIERDIEYKKTGKKRKKELVFGITSRSADEMSADKILKIVRKHWGIENSCHYIIDWNYDEDRNRIRTGFAPENVTRLRRFAVGLMKSKKVENVAQKMRQLSFNVRSVLDYLKMTKNTYATECIAE
jgi:predicted transposase YbfD/YdcC